MRGSIFSTGFQQAVATALICGATLGGYMASSNDGDSFSPSVVSLPTYSASEAPAASPSVPTKRSTSFAVVPHATMNGIGSGIGSASSTSSSASSYSRSTSSSSSALSGVGVSLTSRTGSRASSGGGGVGGGAATMSSGRSSGLIVMAPMMSSGGSLAVASRGPARTSESPGGGGSGGSGGTLTVYDGDAPGIITGEENSDLDNSIISSYGQPIGDALIPLLLLAMIYILYKRKSMTATRTYTLVSAGARKMAKSSSTLLLPLLLSLFLLSPFFSTRALAQTHTEEYDYDGDGVKETYNVVYLNLSGGNNSKDGYSEANAVKTWAQAYSLLPAYTGTTDADRDAAWDSNIIVVCDAQGTPNLFIDETTSGNRPATITGVWPWTADNITYNKVSNGGRLYLCENKIHSGTLTSGTTRIGADTKFKYIRFGGTKWCYLAMYLHDAYFDIGCLTNEFNQNLEVANGATDGRAAPDINVILFANAYSFDKSKEDGGFNSLMRPVTLTIRSGKFGRILSNRVAGDVTTRFVIANPNKPLLCTINIDIDPNTTTGEWNPKNNPDDIAFIAAGMTQGTEFCDVEFNIKRGKIATFVGAMQGTNITGADAAGLSASTFIGRTVVNINPENDDDVVIQRYFAGCQGRYTSGQNTIANVAFYGKSTLNMYGGKIVGGAFLSGGGVSGLKYTDGNGTTYNTTDKFIPFVDNSDSYQNYPFMGIKYQTYKADGVLPTLRNMKNGDTLDISTTETHFNIYGGEISGGLYGGSYGEAPQLTADYAIEGAGSHWGNTYVNVYGGKISGGVYGGGAGTTRFYNEAQAANKARFLTVAQVYGITNVNIYGGEISGGIYGGGKGVNAQAAGQKITITTYDGSKSIDKEVTTVANEFLNIAKVYGNTNVTIDPRMPGDFESKNPDWSYTGNIYGGGAMGAVEGNTNVQILGGNITGNVFAGGLGEDAHADKAKVTGNTEANIQGGTQGSEYAVYGGAQMAQVDGNTTVNLLGGTVGSAYGGGLGTATMAANVSGNATTALNGSKVTGSIFGGNNLNGTPQGHIKVHVLSTTPRDGQTAEQFDVAAVYGGGNQAAYEPSQATFDANKGYTEVLIENCDNSIDYVYGGGNAAPVPATDVTIYGANAINNAFAGGNGAGDGNPGADIGYNGYYSQTQDETPTYGSGESHITIYGGTINNVFGGSNTLGYIREHAYVDLPDNDADDKCELHVGEVYVGGNHAEMYCEGTMTFACSGGVDEIYGGSKQANFYHNVNMNITSGTYGKVFGGNNISGNVKGSITVNIDETGCYPIMIGELYGCGNEAPYSVYGYNDNGSVKTEGEKVYADPTINLISFTQIGKVFGGGLGETAVVYGNPIININPIKGKFAGNNIAPLFVLNASNERVANTDTIAIPNAVGTIGTVYGGGNEAKVYGNTTINIATEETNKHLTLDDAEDEEVDAIITGNVYGGGSMADVHGSTNVTIGKEVAQ